MTPTNQDLQVYVGGQAEIQNQVEQYLYKGRIAAISIDADTFKIRFEWFARKGGKKLPPPLYGNKWVNDKRLDYSVSLMLVGFSLSNAPDGKRIILHSPITNEICVLYLPGRERNLDPEEVEGLDT